MKCFRLLAVLLFIVVLISLIVSCPLNPSNGNDDRDIALRYSAMIQDGEGGLDGLKGARGITVSPDGKQVYVTGFDDDAVVVFNRNTSTGELRYSAIFKDGVGGVDGLDAAWNITGSPDGKSVYVTGFFDDAVAVFNRDTSTGELEYSAVFKDGVGGVDGLYGANDIAVSPNGEQVYVTGYSDNAVAVFNRDTSTGELRYSAIFKDGVGGVDGLGGAAGIIVSSDGKSVYVTGRSDDSVAVFDRDTSTGELEYSAVFKDGVGGVDGLDGAHGITVSSDKKSVYVTGSNDDAVAVFDRDTSTGALTYSTVFKDGVGGVDGLDGAFFITISSDGKQVYVTGHSDDAVAVFNRTTSTGALTYSTVMRDPDIGVDGLDGAEGIIISPDGKQVYVTGINYAAVVVLNRSTTTGVLTYSEVVEDGAGGVDGLNGTNGITISSDGKSVYVAGGVDDSVAVFNRDTGTGELTYSAVFKDGIGGVDGLDNAWGITVSSDGEQVYVAGYDDDAVVVFNRNTSTGELTYSGVIKDGVGGVDGLDGARDITVSSDGKNVYVTGGVDDAVVVFNRDTSTGDLTYSAVFKDGVSGVDGLDGANYITISPNGKQVYVTGYNDDAVVVFNRDISTGELTYSAMIKDGVNGVDGLDGARGIIVSPGGKQVYVTGGIDDSVAVFNRDTSTGELAYSAVIKDNGQGGTADGLDRAAGIAVSSDGEKAYVAGWFDDAVAVFNRNTSTGALTYSSLIKDGVGGVDGLDGVWDIIISPDGKQLYVVSGVDDTVVTFNR